MDTNPYQPTVAQLEEPVVQTENAAEVRRSHLPYETAIKCIAVAWCLGAPVMIWSKLSQLHEIYDLLSKSEYSHFLSRVMWFTGARCAIYCAKSASGLGLLRLKRWARPLATFASVLAVIDDRTTAFLSVPLLFLLWSSRGSTLLSPSYREIVDRTREINPWKTRITVITVVLLCIFGLGPALVQTYLDLHRH